MTHTNHCLANASFINVKYCFNFQHPFIRGELDPKPVRDLLLEYKADVVEEEVVDEDAEVSFFIHFLLACQKLCNCSL